MPFRSLACGLKNEFFHAGREPLNPITRAGRIIPGLVRECRLPYSRAADFSLRGLPVAIDAESGNATPRGLKPAAQGCTVNRRVRLSRRRSIRFTVPLVLPTGREDPQHPLGVRQIICDGVATSQVYQGLAQIAFVCKCRRRTSEKRKAL